jgi:predicted Rossmann fold nucleotide-binding protein DprA/Smf involved in DNA uptake
VTTNPTRANITQLGASIAKRLRQAGALASTCAVGNEDCLRPRLLALLCSIRCPGNVILCTYDAAVALREAGVAVAGGFHSPMEQECLRLLLRGTQPVVVCPARGIQRMRLPSEWKQPLAEGRLLILSPFEEQQRRATRQLAVRRNQFVAALADEVPVAHATHGGKTERLCHQIIAWGKSILILDCPENAHLVSLGAQPLDPAAIPSRLPPGFADR